MPPGRNNPPFCDGGHINPFFRRGTLFREALNVLRITTAPMTAKEIAARVIEANGLALTYRQRRDFEGAIRSSLTNHFGNTVERIGEGIPKRWRLLA